jgi:hypothetical protein
VKVILSKMQQLGLTINAFFLNQDEISYLQNHGQQLSGIDFNGLTTDTLSRLAAYAETRNMARATQITSSSLTSPLLQILRWASRKSNSTTSLDLPTISKEITSSTGWDVGVFEQVLPILAKTTDSAKVLVALKDETLVETLFKMIDTIRKIGVDAKNVSMVFDVRESFEQNTSKTCFLYAFVLEGKC